jgi:hypothetical protein
MRVTAQIDEELLAGGPCIAWAKALRIIRPPSERRVARPLLASVFLGWIPLAGLATIEVLFGNTSARSFFTDAAVSARFLLAVPLLVLAEADAIPLLGRLSHHFLDSGLVGPEDLERYKNAVSSTRRLIEARAATIITFLLAYVIVAILILNLTQENTPAWYWAGPGPLELSPPGLWHAFISVPLLIWLCLGWFWRLLLWWRFLALMARQNLRLIPSHPDHAGGLKFISTAIRAHRLLALSLGVIVAGTEVNGMLHAGVPHLGYQYAAATVAGVMVVLAAGPLSMFIAKLRNFRLMGMLRYGPLASAVAAEFEKKWLDSKDNKIDATALEASDFSAMTDLYQVAGNVYDIGDVPFHWKDLIPVVVAAAIPFIPAALMTVPLKDILEAVKALVL